MRQVLSSHISRIICLFILPVLCFPIPDVAGQNGNQDSLISKGPSVIINRISVDGNHQTRSSIILRELLFHEHDTLLLRTFSEAIRSSRQNIFNTRLFNFVTIDTACEAGNFLHTDVMIHVVERWYIWPIPYFEISDRNINSWLATMDFSRLTYGIDLTISNVRGRNETLRFPVHFGFNRQFGFDYTIPYINRKKTIGFGVGVQLDQNHELIVKSVNNKPVYYKDPTGFIQQNIYSYLEMRFRPSIYSYHSVRLSYSAYSFSDSLLHIPNYAYHDKAYLNFFTIYYQMKADHRDIAYYPLKGSYFDFLIEQNGLWNSPVNELYVKSNFRIYRQLYKRWYYAAGVTAKYTFTGASPYFLQEGLGYGREFVRGYEYYVIDGTHFALFKNNLKFALIRPGVLDVGFLKSQKFNPIPYAFYLNLFADLGYVYNGDEEQGRINDLQNKLLIGGGIGIDFATYYDIVTRVEFSINRNGFPGVYLHFTAPI